MQLLTVLAAATTVPPTVPVTRPDSGWSAWGVVVAAGVVVGLVAATQQIVASVRNRRRNAAMQRVMDLAASQLDATAVKQEVDRYTALREELKEQIDHELPREARRIYVNERLQHLSRVLADSFEEYEMLRAEQAQLAPSSPLADRLRAVIETDVLPGRRQAHRRQSRRTTLIVVLLLAGLSPLPSLPYLVIETFASPVTSSTLAVVLSVLATAALVAGLTAGALNVRVPADRRPRPTPDEWWRRGVLAGLSAVALAWGFEERQGARSGEVGFGLRQMDDNWPVRLLLLAGCVCLGLALADLVWWRARRRT